MRILLNERPIDVPEGTRVADVAREHKPNADVFVLNGFPAPGTTVLRGEDHLVLIRKGEAPRPEELDALLSARHTPGVAERLRTACVAVAGLGGLGSNVALALCRVGVGRLLLCDFDVVEPSNLNRQQYFLDQIGRPKAEALRSTLLRVNPNVSAKPLVVRLTPENVPVLLAPADVIVEAFDRADQKDMLVSTVLQRLPTKPLILGSGMAGWGGNQLLRTRRSGGLSVVGDECSEAGAGFGLMAPRVGAVAHLQANLVMELLLGADPGVTAAARAAGRSVE